LSKHHDSGMSLKTLFNNKLRLTGEAFALPVTLCACESRTL